MGFVLNSKLLIIAGALDGASGFILSMNMSKAMNRSFSNVLFARSDRSKLRCRRGRSKTRAQRDRGRSRGNSFCGNKVVIVPGYGMA